MNLREFASRRITARQILDNYRTWISGKLGSRIEEVVLGA
jgi:hypothetical protein